MRRKPNTKKYDSELLDAYREKLGLFEELKSEAVQRLQHALTESKIKIHSLTSRVKEENSFLNKVHSLSPDLPLLEITDIVGLRVVCLLLSDVERIGEVIRLTFRVKKEDNKIEGMEASSFGYMSVHFIVAFREPFDSTAGEELDNVAFEIQVRTIAMDAWANVSHYLLYRREKDIPGFLRKDFHALSGLFYVADRQFELFYEASKRSEKHMTYLFGTALNRSTGDQEMNRDSLAAYLLFKFPERKEGTASAMSTLLEALREANYGTISEVEALLNRASQAIDALEKEEKIFANLNRIDYVHLANYLVNPQTFQGTSGHQKMLERARMKLSGYI